MLKTEAGGLALPRDLANVNAWKTMFDPYNNSKTNATYETTDAQIKKKQLNIQ